MRTSVTASTFFFILLVIPPVLAVATVGILIVATRRTKNSTALEQAQRAAQALYGDARERAEVVAAGRDGQQAGDGGARREPRGAADAAGGPRGPRRRGRVRLTLRGEGAGGDGQRRGRARAAAWSIPAGVLPVGWTSPSRPRRRAHEPAADAAGFQA